MISKETSNPDILKISYQNENVSINTTNETNIPLSTKNGYISLNSNSTKGRYCEVYLGNTKGWL